MDTCLKLLFSHYTSFDLLKTLSRSCFHLIFRSGKTQTKERAHGGWVTYCTAFKLQRDTVRWLILPNFPSGAIWDTICLTLIMAEPSPISPSLWDIAWACVCYRLCEFEQMKNELFPNLAGRIRKHSSASVWTKRQQYDKLIMLSWFFSWQSISGSES